MSNDYINTALNFTGSKFKLLDQILPEIDYTKKYFVDLFAGSGVVGFNVVDKYDKILCNDIINDLVGIHKNVIYDFDIFIEKVKSLCVSKEDQEGFNKLRKEYNSNKTPEGLYALMLCSTNNMMRFNQKFEYNQTFGKRSFSESTQKKLDLFIEYIQKHRNKIIFSSSHFSEIKITKPSMIYLDPPYLETEAGYNSYFSNSDGQKLYNYCKDLDKNGHSFMMSGVLGEHKNGKRSKLIDDLISDGYRYKILDFDYEKVARNKNTKNSQEVIIMNY
jgi:DNA adenine methylase Dam